MCSPVNVPQPANRTNPEAAAQLLCLEGLTALYRAVHSQVQQNSSSGSANALGLQPESALADDFQLRGFLPLQPCHDKLNFDKPQALEQVSCSFLTTICCKQFTAAEQFCGRCCILELYIALTL